MAPIDWAIVLAFVAYALWAGLRSRRSASRSLEEYFLAGRGLPGWKAGLSMAATQFAADTPLLVTGLIATAGIFGLWRLWIYAVAFLLMGFVLAPSWRRARVLTDAELTELRYAGRPAAALRAVKALYFGTVFNCTVLAMVLFAAKDIAEPFLLWHAWLPEALYDPVREMVVRVGVPFAREAGSGDLWLRSADNLISLAALLAVTLAYSATGGLRGVVQTDVGQLALMLLGTAAYAAVVLHEAGGMDAIGESLAAHLARRPGAPSADEILAFTPSRAKDATLALLAVYGLQWLVQMNADGTGYLAQRSMACRSDADAKQAAVVFTVTQVLLRSLLWIPIGLGLLVLFPPELAWDAPGFAASREASFVRGMAELLPAGVKGLMLTAMLAALASTIDTHMNWGASYWTHDLYRRFWCRWRGQEPSARALVWVARGSTFGIVGVALFVMTRLSSIQVAWQLSLLLGAGMGVPLVLRWLWWRMNAWGELAAIGSSAVLAPVLLFALPAGDEAGRLLLLAAVSSTTALVASLATAPEPAERLRAFAERARPPGFWGPVGGDDDGVRRLRRGLAATLLAAFSLFCALTGLGSWLAGSPAPRWLPWRGPWIAGLLLLAAALVPLWWRLGFGTSVAETAHAAPSEASGSSEP